MSQRETQRKTQKEKPYEIVDIMDIDVNELSFLKPKPNEHGGKFIGLRYKGKIPYVKTPRRKVLFGAGKNTDMKPNPLYVDSKKCTGYNASMTFGNEYEEDALFQKYQELDEFFIDACVENSFIWGLGGSKSKSLDRESVAGYDDHGDNGKWKRLVKWAYRKNKETNEREYLDYPPHYEINMPCTITDETNEAGKIEQTALFRPTFYDADGNKQDGVTSDEIDDVFPAWSESSCLSMWNRITVGTYGASLRPKAQQFRVYPSEGLPQDECFLEADEDEDEAMEVPEMALNDQAPPKQQTEPEENEDLQPDDEVEDEAVVEVEEEAKPVARKTVARSTRKLTIKTK